MGFTPVTRGPIRGITVIPTCGTAPAPMMPRVSPGVSIFGISRAGGTRQKCEPRSPGETSTPAVPGLVYLAHHAQASASSCCTVHYRALLVYHYSDSQNGSSAVRTVTRYGLR